MCSTQAHPWRSRGVSSARPFPSRLPRPPTPARDFGPINHSPLAAALTPLALQVKRGHHILCKSTKALPYLNKPHKRNSWRRFVWWWVDPPVDAEITSRPAPARIDGPTVTFVDGTRADFDVVLLATGYTQRFPFLHPPRTTHAPDPRGGATAPRGIEDPLPSDHFVVDPAEPRLAFIGFVRPNVGAIPPMAEMQSMWWIARLRGQVTAHRDPPSYGLLGRKLAYGVDYGNYMHQLAAEFGAAPAVSQLARRPRVLLAYCLGQVRGRGRGAGR